MKITSRKPSDPGKYGTLRSNPNKVHTAVHEGIAIHERISVVVDYMSGEITLMTIGEQGERNYRVELTKDEVRRIITIATEGKI